MTAASDSTATNIAPKHSIIPMLFLILVVSSCGERTSNAKVEQISRSLADVMIAVQRGADSTQRARIADSVAASHGYDGWIELRDAVEDVAVEPERLRLVLDSTQRRIESRASDTGQKKAANP